MLPIILKVFMCAQYKGANKHKTSQRAPAMRPALTCVSLHVAIQGGLHSEALPAFVTSVWLFSRVDSNMPSQEALAIQYFSFLCDTQFKQTS